jgi:hypothetical protein
VSNSRSLVRPRPKLSKGLSCAKAYDPEGPTDPIAQTLMIKYYR